MPRTPATKRLKVGKLPNSLLAKLLSKVKIADESVVLGPRVGEDAAVIRLGGLSGAQHAVPLLVAKSDPITFASDLVGWYAVHVNANDIATRGVKPRWFLATVLLPEAATARQAEQILDQILSACESLGVTLVGGHTEVTLGFSRPVVVGAMFSEAEAGRVVSTSGARPGDDIVLTKGIAIEGTAVLAREAAARLRRVGVPREVVRTAADYLFSPGISIVKEALVAAGQVEVHSMHDPTEGGVATGLYEIGLAAGCGIEADAGSIPVLPECQAICDRLHLDPMGLLASGALLITLPASQSPLLIRVLGESGIEARVIGKMVEARCGMWLRSANGDRALPGFERDELASFMEREQ